MVNSKSKMKALARDAFTEVGNELQGRRRDDFHNCFDVKLADTLRFVDSFTVI